MIRSRQNQIIKNIRGLRRRQGDHLLLEGPRLLAEARRAGISLDLVLMSPSFAERNRETASSRDPASEPILVEESLLASLCDADSPQGVLALAHRPRPGAEGLPARAGAIYLYLDGVQEPGNLGAIARVAEAFGAAGMALAPGCAHPNHPRALRASAGSLLRLPVAVAAPVAEVDGHLGDLAPIWIGLVARAGASPTPTEVAGSIVLVLGSEGAGISRAVAERLDRTWTIPLAAPVESLNVAVAAGVALFDLQRERAGRG